MLVMRTDVFVFSCLACIGCGQTSFFSNEHFAGSPGDESHVPLKVHHRCLSRSLGQSTPAQALAILLLSAHPVTAFSPANPGFRPRLCFSKVHPTLAGSHSQAPRKLPTFSGRRIPMMVSGGFLDEPEAAANLRDAELRASSKARAKFVAAARAESSTVLELATLLAAEERLNDEPAVVSKEVDSQIELLVEQARTRLRLASLIGGNSSDPETIITSVSTTLFGTGGTDDEMSNATFFKGNNDDYYDPRNSFIDIVLQRGQGIPITLSLVHAEVCGRLGYPMVGLNAPFHLLIAPADDTLPFVIDPFNRGEVLSAKKAATQIAAFDGIDPAQGSIGLQLLRSQPMTAHTWCARMLRNLRNIYEEVSDTVGLLAAAERLRIIGQKWPETTTKGEQFDTAVQIAFCLFKLGWKARRTEAMELLHEFSEDSGLPSDSRQHLEVLISMLDTYDWPDPKP